MSNKLVGCIGFLLVAVLVLPGYMAPNPGINVKYPKKVDTTIQDKCYGCHSPEGRSQKAKDALMWDELQNLNMAAQLGKFAAIQKVIHEGTMPPKGAVERNPAMKLSDQESAQMEKWASKMLRKTSRKMK